MNALPSEQNAAALRAMRQLPLGRFFAPRSVAVIGASEREASVGRALWENLRGFGGPVFPVNPHRADVFGVAAFARVADLPAKADLALIAAPARLVPELVRECGAAGVRSAIVLSAGFKECGPAGAELENRVVQAAREGGVRIIGPNCLGLMAPPHGLNATFAAAMARPGDVAFVSQSGALCTAVLDWSLRDNVGFSAMVSVGAMVDVGWGELITHFGADPHTRSILLYMESIGEARSFLSAAREVALTKPIIVVKAGRSAAAAKAAASHTGALTGSDAVVDAAFRRAGVLRVDSIEELFDLAEVFGKQPRPQGPRLGIITNAGGPAALAVDRLVAGGGEVAPLTAQTLAALGEVLPAHWSRADPVDILGDADARRFGQAVELVANDPTTDAVLVILTPQAMTDARATAATVAAWAGRSGAKPLFASWMGGPAVEAGEAVLNAAGIPTFAFPDRAAQAFNAMWRYRANLAALYETPTLRERATPHVRAERIIGAARQAGRVTLTELESKAILGLYGIPAVETLRAATVDEAVAVATAIGFPVVVKIYSETITHKADVGGVRLNIRDAGEVADAWRSIRRAVAERAGAHHFQGVTVEQMICAEGHELILGSSVDPQFGPVLLFGAGGRWVEARHDHVIGLPPLTSTLARRLMEQTRIFAALQGTAGRPAADLAGLEQVLVRFSQLVAEERGIKEIDVNPLLVSADRIVALDARVILHAPDIAEAGLPALAIRPYPEKYTAPCLLADGTPLVVRPIRPEDEPMLGRFHGALAPEQRTSHEGLARLCFIDYAREIGLVAVHREPGAADAEILGVARLGRVHGRDTAEFAVVVADRWQRRGLGTVLLGRLLAVGRAEGVTRLAAMVPEGNAGMRRLCEKLGFRLTAWPGGRRWIAAINPLRAAGRLGPGGAVSPAGGQAGRDDEAEAGRPAAKNAHDPAIAAEAPPQNMRS